MGGRRLPSRSKLPFFVLGGVYVNHEIFSFKGKKALNFNLLLLSKREQKTNYLIDSYFQDSSHAGPSKTDIAPKIPRAPK
jgi:hypothetical protein